jgi:hypothetical protein
MYNNNQALAQSPGENTLEQLRAVVDMRRYWGCTVMKVKSRMLWQALNKNDEGPKVGAVMASRSGRQGSGSITP